MGADAKKQKQMLTSQALLQMITYIKDHPTGLDEDGIVFLLKTWTVIDKNFGEAHYWHGKYQDLIKKAGLLGTVTADSTMPTGDPNDSDTAPKLSQTLYHKLNHLTNQVYNDNVYEHTLPFNQAEGALATLVYAFRIKLAQEDPDRAKKFLHTLTVLEHQLN